MTARIKKINHLILEELSKIILREIDFPKNIFTTLQKAETSSDLTKCKISVSVFPQASAKQALLILNNQSKHLHYLLSKKIILRKIPHLRFILQDIKTDPERVSGLLDEIALENTDKKDKI